MKESLKSERTVKKMRKKQAERTGKTKPDRMRKLLAIALMTVFIPTVIAIGVLQWQDRHYYIVSMIIILLALLPFALVFERRRPKTRELVLIAVMTAIAVAGRAVFYMLPQFKPVAAVVIVTGIAFGCEAGFATGALAMFASNMLFGQGPWTPWQMFAMGIIGFISGFLFKNGIKTRLQHIMLCVVGALLTCVVYGVIVDTSSLFTIGNEVSLKALLAMYASGIPFNVIHGASTAFFLFVLARPVLNKLKRIKLKYGLMQ